MDESGSFELKGKLLGGYRILSRLGAGGMGSVYKAYDEGLDRHVAIKVLSPTLEMDRTCVARFLREAKSIAAISHPNLMHIYAVGEEKGVHYFAMEHISGISLSRFIDSHKKIGLDDALRIIEQIMSALHRVHQDDIIHRDLKPGNVMIDTDGRAVLVDFGLSKDTTANMDLTGAGAIMGTPDYMAPEQIEGEEIGSYTDIYALGVMLFEMLTSVKPFRKKSAVMTMRAHCEMPPPDLLQHRPDLPKIMGAILKKAMARSVEKRYSSIARMAADLIKFHHTPVLAELAEQVAFEKNSATVLASSAGVTASDIQAATAPTIKTSRTPVSQMATIKSGHGKVAKSGGKSKSKRAIRTASKKKPDNLAFHIKAAGIGLAVGLTAGIILLVVGLSNNGGDNNGANPNDRKKGAAVTGQGGRDGEIERIPTIKYSTSKGVSRFQVVIRKTNGEILRGICVSRNREKTVILDLRNNDRVEIPNDEIDILRPVSEQPKNRRRRF